MTRKKPTKRERILQATKEILLEKKDAIITVTTREIAERAQVGIGMINYHFQTKDNLIRQVLRLELNEKMQELEETYANEKISPLERMKRRSWDVVRYVVRHPTLAKLSFQYDLLHPSADDSTSQYTRVVVENLRQIYGDCKSEQELKRRALWLMAPVYVLILRSELAGELYGFDPSNMEEWVEVIEDALKSLLPDIEEERE